MNNRTIYLSGRISGLTPQQAEANFRLAERQLTLAPPYYKNVVNPLDIRPLFGIKNWYTYMAADIWQLIWCDDIFMLYNWSESRGAKIEHKISKFLGLNIYYQ